MAVGDDAIVSNFIHRLDAGEMDGQFNAELSKLSYPQLLTLARSLAGYAASKDDSITHGLTRREREILTLIASGRSSKQIAAPPVCSQNPTISWNQQCPTSTTFSGERQLFFPIVLPHEEMLPNC